MDPTYRQMKSIFMVTCIHSKHWDAHKPQFDKNEASKIISKGFYYFFETKKTEGKAAFEEEVRRWFPDFNAPDNPFFFKKSKSKKTMDTDSQVSENQKQTSKAKKENLPAKTKEETKTKATSKPTPTKTKKEKSPIPTEKPAIYNEAMSIIQAGLNLRLTGPAGCGKTYLVRTIAQELNLNLFVLSCSGGLRRSDVYGSTQIINGETIWQPSRLLEAIQKPGIVFLDEFTGMDEDISHGLNGMVEPNTREIETPNGKIEVHPDCRFVAAANTTGRSVSRQYTANKRQDDSLLDRFNINLHITYDNVLEKKILLSMGLNGDGDKLIKFTTNLREKVKEHNIPFDASTRRLVSCAELCVKANFKPERAFELAMLADLSNAERSKVTM